jgi:hypothetical protein
MDGCISGFPRPAFRPIKNLIFIIPSSPKWSHRTLSRESWRAGAYPGRKSPEKETGLVATLAPALCLLTILSQDFFFCFVLRSRAGTAPRRQEFRGDVKACLGFLGIKLATKINLKNQSYNDAGGNVWRPVWAGVRAIWSIQTTFVSTLIAFWHINGSYVYNTCI